MINKKRLTFGAELFLGRAFIGTHPLPAGSVSLPELGEVGGVGLASSSNEVTVKSLSGIAPNGLES